MEVPGKRSQDVATASNSVASRRDLFTRPSLLMSVSLWCSVGVERSAKVRSDVAAKQFQVGQETQLGDIRSCVPHKLGSYDRPISRHLRCVQPAAHDEPPALCPTEGLLDLLAAFLRQGVTGVAGVDGGMADLVGDMRRDAGLSQMSGVAPPVRAMPRMGDEIGAVVALFRPPASGVGSIRANGDGPSHGAATGPRPMARVKCGTAFGMAISAGQVCLNDQAVALRRVPRTSGGTRC